MRYKVTPVLLSLALALGVIVGGAEPASAAACYGASCAGRPATLCSGDATTVEYGTLRLRPGNQFWGRQVFSPTWRGPSGQVRFELRYSPSCRANWARVWDMSPELYGELSVWNPGAASRKTWISDGGGGTWFTPMVDGVKAACFGMQIYSGGRWRTWQMGYCA